MNLKLATQDTMAQEVTGLYCNVKYSKMLVPL